MNFLQGIFLGGSFFSKPESSTPFVPIEYDELEIFGDADGFVDKIYVTTESHGKMIPNIEPVWTPLVIIFADFFNSLSCGNIVGITNPVLNYIVYRRRDTDTIFKKLATIPVEQTEYNDYEVKSNKQYLYRVFAQSTDELSSPLDADPVDVKFETYSFTDEDTGETYVFSLDVSPSSIVTNSGLIVRESPYAEKPHINQRKTKYIVGNLSAVAGSIDIDTGELIYPQDYIDGMRDFFYNGKTKIYKDPRGRGWKVRTDNFVDSYKRYSPDQIANISLSFVEKKSLDS